MATVGHRIEYAAALLGRSIARSFTPRGAERVGVALGSMAHGIMKGRREIAFDNLKHALGDSYTDTELSEIVREVFRNIGRMMLEYARFGKTRPKDLLRMIEPHGQEALEKALAEGRGAVMAIPHFGNWEMLGAWPAAAGYPTDLLVATQHNPLVDRMITEFRTCMGAGVIRTDTGVRGVFKSLKANRVVPIACDQHSPSGNIITDFFGRPAATARGPALFALRCDCPIIPMVLRRECHDHHVIMAAEPLYPPRSGDEEADIRYLTETYTRFFEDCITTYPDQWLWTHRRWKLPEESAQQTGTGGVE
ncbi:MAG: lysophospholipid acyltransferase family protein [candidate division Zixibacteria bacterium]|nr:lysophospholipid acyltransferase family protein [candidate division Zixibacteria bacterium]